MEILKLLSLFNIECKLSDQLLKLDVDDCLKNAKFTIVGIFLSLILMIIM